MVLQLIQLTKEIPWLSEIPEEWPPCLWLSCLPPAHAFKGVRDDIVQQFVGAQLTMFCRVLHMRLGRDRVKECLFDKPGTGQRSYPFGELCGPN